MNRSLSFKEIQLFQTIEDSFKRSDFLWNKKKY